jgi:DUF971 family protein
LGISLESEGKKTYIKAKKVRSECRCAACIEEFTGQQILDKGRVPDTIKPTSILPMGNYAVSIQWSDGHTSSVYPYELLKKIAEQN